MTTPTPVPSISSPPTPAQFALALLVLKSKPVESSLEDYVLQLRRCVKSGGRLVSRHLDSCAFWKQAYETLEVAHGCLLDENRDLRQQNEEMRNNFNPPKAADLQAGIKRKRSGNPAAKQSTVRKRSRLVAKDKGTQNSIEPLSDTRVDGENTEGSNESSAVFAKNLFALRRHLSASGSEDNMLAMCLKRTCASADETLSRSIKSHLFQPTNRVKAKGTERAACGDPSQVPNALRFCCPSLFQAVKKLNPDGVAGHCAVYALVQLFQNILGHLHTVTATQADKTCKQKVRTAKQQPLPHSNQNGMCVSLTKLAIQFFEALDLSQPSHNRVLEGLICVFLDHLGSSLSLVVFADVDAPASQTPHLGFLPPRGLLDTSGLDRKAAIRTIEYEACYLVTILRHLLLCIDKQQPLLRSESVPLLTFRKTLATSDCSLSARVQERLQNTLLRGVFGDDDESFKDAFQRSGFSAVEAGFSIASSGGEEPGEWFIGEVWRLLGWHILTGQK